MTDLEVIDAEVGQEIVLASAAPPANLFRAEEPGEIVERASQTAKALSAVLKKQKLTTSISGRQHVRVEGWTLLGSMLGVFPVCVWTKRLENGWEARVEARTLAGAIVGAAEAECLRSEKTWASRDDFALRSMAQTRATSKALRQPLGFVVSLAGFDPTPAEEMAFDSGAGTHQPTGEKTGGSSRTRQVEHSAPEPDPEGSPLASPSPEPSGFTFEAPKGPRGGKATQIEADELAAELEQLVQQIGATESLASVETHREKGDVTWLKRQIAAAKHHLDAA